MTLFEVEAEARLLAAEGQKQMSRALTAWASRALRSMMHAVGCALGNHPSGVLPH